MKRLNIKTLFIAGSLICLSLTTGGRASGIAQPLEITPGLRIPGPPLVFQRPLDLSLEERFKTQQLVWECRLREEMRSRVRNERNTDSGTVEENPLPALSAFLADAHRFLRS